MFSVKKRPKIMSCCNTLFLKKTKVHRDDTASLLICKPKENVLNFTHTDTHTHTSYKMNVRVKNVWSKSYLQHR